MPDSGPFDPTSAGPHPEEALSAGPRLFAVVGGRLSGSISLRECAMVLYLLYVGNR
jgi:hypothetical protein